MPAVIARWLCARHGHYPQRVDPGDADQPWRWWCSRCGEWLDQ